jgi:hypothetical protein
MMIAKYFKSVGFYFFEFVGGLINLACSFFSYYPCLDLGVRFWVVLESKRIFEEKAERSLDRQEKEEEASSLHKKAKEDGQNA